MHSCLRPEQDIGVVLMGKRNSSDGTQLFYDLAGDLLTMLAD